MRAALSQSEEISSDFCCFYGGGIRHNEDIMHSFQNFIVRLIPNHPPPLETRIWKLVVRALDERFDADSFLRFLDEQLLPAMNAFNGENLRSVLAMAEN